MCGWAKTRDRDRSFTANRVTNFSRVSWTEGGFKNVIDLSGQWVWSPNDVVPNICAWRCDRSRTGRVR
jgi:hypothetical protein